MTPDDKKNQVLLSLRAALGRARTLPEADRMCALALRQMRWLPQAEKDQLAYEIGGIIGELMMTRFRAHTDAIVASLGASQPKA